MNLFLAQFCVCLGIQTLCINEHSAASCSECVGRHQGTQAVGNNSIGTIMAFNLLTNRLMSVPRRGGMSIYHSKETGKNKYASLTGVLVKFVMTGKLLYGIVM